MTEHLARVILVRKRDIFKIHFAAHMFAGNGIRRVGDVRLFVHDFQKAVNAGHAALELLHELDNAAN